MIETDKIAVSNLVKACQANHIKDIVISPGSRNAPLTISFSNNPYFNCYSIVDERSAGFFALGIAQQKRRPVAVVSTSGTATLNYAPAVAEAYFQSIPLLVLTADRQKNGLEIGDGQVMNQNEVYKNYAKSSFTLFEQEEEREEENIKLINEALQEVSSPYQGPVHINIPLAECLYTKVESTSTLPTEIVQKPLTGISEEKVIELAKRWNSIEKKLILVSSLPAGDELSEALIQLTKKDKNVVILTETTANTVGNDFFPCIDRTIEAIPKEIDSEYIPDLILTLGNSIISKKVKQLFRTHPPKEHWSVFNPRHENVFHMLTEKIDEKGSEFIAKLTDSISDQEDNSFSVAWKGIKKETENLHTSYLKQTPFSDLKAFECLLRDLPSCNLQMGNSSVVRYIQLFEQRQDLTYNGNRGVSGIEGCTSTAIGASLVTQNTILISGDISFFYDSNAFWNGHVPAHFKAIVINNGEGNIFNILPQPKEDETSLPFFTTPHQTSIRKFCDLYNLNYYKATNENELTEELEQFVTNATQASVLEIRTNEALNDTLLTNYFKYLKEHTFQRSIQREEI